MGNLHIQSTRLVFATGLFCGSSAVFAANETVSGVTISPDPATVAYPLICSWTFTDDEGDADSSDVEWSVNGELVATDVASAISDSELSNGYIRGDVVTCTVTAFDGIDSGNASSTNIIIDNSPPEVLASDLSPSVAYTDDTLTVEVLSSDADDDEVTYRYEWYVDDGSGADLQVVTENTLDGTSYFESGDSVSVKITPNDGFEDGVAYTVSEIDISNTPPVVSSIEIGPSSPGATDTLICTTTTSDADDDDVTIRSHSWTVNGIELSGASSDTLAPTRVVEDSIDTGDESGVGDTGDSASLVTNFVEGDSVFCSAVPEDAEGVGASVDSEAVTIGEEEVEVDDTAGVPTYSASEQSGQQSGFGCALRPTGAGLGVVWLAFYALIGWRRERV